MTHGELIDERDALRRDLAAANERTRAAEAARDVADSLVRRVARQQRRRLNHLDKSVVDDVVAYAGRAIEAAAPTASVPVVATPESQSTKPVHDPKSCDKCGRDWYVATDGTWTVNHRRECPNVTWLPPTPACPRCKDFNLTKVVDGVTVWQAHASKGDSPRMWCRESGQPVPVPAEAAATPPKETR